MTGGGTATDGVDHQNFLTQLGTAAGATAGVSLAGNTLTFDSAFVGPTFTFDVTAIDDTLVEGTETLTATLSGAVGATINAGQTVASTNITETDAVVFGVTSTVSISEEVPDTATFTMNLGGVTLGAGQTATVNV